MAYYSSVLYEEDAGEYYGNPNYAISYDIVPFQESDSYSSYEFNETGLSEYGSTGFVGAYDPFLSQAEMYYNSTCSVIDPKPFVYNPVSYSISYFSSEPQYVISYSATAELIDDTEFVEYDPTPYAGGYNPALTYGKPLPASDEICYPRSSPNSNVPLPDNFSYRSIPSPYDDVDTDKAPEKPSTKTKPTESDEGKQQPSGVKKENGHVEKSLDSDQGEQREGYAWDGNYYPWSGYGYGYGYGVVREQVPPQIPYGYGLEAMDLCECLFGYRPCLSKNKRRNSGQQGVGREGSQENQWSCAADYLFGSPYYGAPTNN